jgi:hypothetical protein
VVPIAQLDEDIYASLFVNAGGRDSVDRRHQWVQAVFGREPAAAAPSLQPPFETAVRIAPAVDSSSLRPPGEAAVRVASAVGAVLRPVRVRRSGGQRVVYADIATSQPVTVSLALTRRDRTIARRVVGGVTGPRRLKLVIPASAVAGPARLRVRFRNDAGGVKVVMRRIRIPHA